MQTVDGVEQGSCVGTWTAIGLLRTSAVTTGVGIAARGRVDIAATGHEETDEQAPALHEESIDGHRGEKQRQNGT